MSKALVILSGGQDSTTCLYWAQQRYDDVHAITFDYGQRHRREISCATVIAKSAGVASHEVVRLGPILAGKSPLVSDNNLEQYKDHLSLPGGLEKTFVPMRNQLFITIAANRAYVLGCAALVTGVSQEDYGGYPDCRESFIQAITEACNLGTFTEDSDCPEGLKIETPLMNLSKAETVLLAIGIPGCYGALAYTHTGYDGVYPPIGKDHASLLRAKGFEEAMVPDPLVLRAACSGLMSYPNTVNYRQHIMQPWIESLRVKGIV